MSCRLVLSPVILSRLLLPTSKIPYIYSVPIHRHRRRTATLHLSFDHLPANFECCSPHDVGFVDLFGRVVDIVEQSRINLSQLLCPLCRVLPFAVFDEMVPVSRVTRDADEGEVIVAKEDDLLAELSWKRQEVGLLLLWWHVCGCRRDVGSCRGKESRRKSLNRGKATCRRERQL